MVKSNVVIYCTYTTCLFLGQIKNVLLHLLLQKRREAQAASGILDEAAQELLEANMEERVKLEAEIEEMRKKSVSNNLYRNVRLIRFIPFALGSFYAVHINASSM